MPGTTHRKHNVTFQEDFSLHPCIYYANQKLKSDIKLLNKVQNYVFYDSAHISCMTYLFMAIKLHRCACLLLHLDTVTATTYMCTVKGAQTV
jgi:hypothetical protein